MRTVNQVAGGRAISIVLWRQMHCRCEISAQGSRFKKRIERGWKRETEECHRSTKNERLSRTGRWAEKPRKIKECQSMGISVSKKTLSGDTQASKRS